MIEDGRYKVTLCKNMLLGSGVESSVEFNIAVAMTHDFSGDLSGCMFFNLPTGKPSENI